MDFKILIKCEKCKCTFELRPKEFQNRGSLHCPNCGQMLREDVFSHLRAGILELSEVPETVPEGASFLPFNDGEIPEFSLKLNGFDMFEEN